MDLVKRFDICLVNLDPTLGCEINKTRPCIIISPDEMNQYIGTVIIAPMTSTIRAYPSRVSINFQEKKGEVVLDQIRTVDKRRLVKKIGQTNAATREKICKTLVEMFSY